MAPRLQVPEWKLREWIAQGKVSPERAASWQSEGAAEELEPGIYPAGEGRMVVGLGAPSLMSEQEAQSPGVQRAVADAYNAWQAERGLPGLTVADAAPAGAPAATSATPAVPPARRPTVRTGPTAPITAPGQYESLARYAPGQESERQAALRYAAGRGGNGTSAPAQMVSLAMGGAQGPDAEALTPTQQALKWAAQRNMLAQAARIGGTAIGRGDAPGYAALERAAGEPVAALQMEQAEADRAEGLRRQQAMMDPASPESRAVQKLLSTVPGLKDVAGEVPAGQAELALKAAEARQKGMPSADAAERLALQREGLELRRQLGGAQLEESRARRAENESFRQALFSQREEKMAREAGERAVPGYGFAPGQFPSAQSAERMRDALSRVNQIQNSLGSMRDIWKRSGAELGWGAERATSQSDRQDILLNLKELQNLGVLQKVDVDTLEKVIPDPNTLRGAFLPRDIEAKFDTFERQLRSTIATRAAARGYVPAGGEAAPPAPGGGAGQVERRRLPDGRVLERGPDGKVRVIGG